ncbi:hypothetical protein C491_15127 [Natronococcus amylolyticus DSM 10524]|uniref:Uncharacterized protein n=1 Tax=Natronococcus amylolyticus DSM 10524 TaxID=1227497 RepID=L9X494_9EURY|nr:hypothetical protein C491_15127 [Natronococcus amylolyticus DSM 10524]
MAEQTEFAGRYIVGSYEVGSLVNVDQSGSIWTYQTDIVLSGNMDNIFLEFFPFVAGLTETNSNDDCSRDIDVATLFQD